MPAKRSVFSSYGNVWVGQYQTCLINTANRVKYAAYCALSSTVKKALYEQYSSGLNSNENFYERLCGHFIKSLCGCGILFARQSSC